MFFLFNVLDPVSGVLAQERPVLRKIHGEVRVFGPGTPRGRKAAVGMFLDNRQGLQTLGHGAVADIFFENGSLIRVMPDSKIVFSRLETRPGVFNVAFELARGKVFSRVYSPLETYRFVVITPQARVRSKRETLFSAETGGRQSVFLVKKGKIKVKNPRTGTPYVLVEGLRSTRVDESRPPTRPWPLTEDEYSSFNVVKDFGRVREKLERDQMDKLFDDLFDD